MTKFMVWAVVSSPVQWLLRPYLMMKMRTGCSFIFTCSKIYFNGNLGKLVLRIKREFPCL